MVFVEFFAYYFGLLIEQPFSFMVSGMLPLPVKASLSGESDFDVIWQIFVEICGNSS